MTSKSKAGRKPLGEAPMTALERKHRQLAKKQQWLEEHNMIECPPLPVSKDLYDVALLLAKVNDVGSNAALVNALHLGLALLARKALATPKGLLEACMNPAALAEADKIIARNLPDEFLNVTKVTTSKPE